MGYCYGTEVGLSIVQAITVYMVNDKVSGGIDNQAVHFGMDSFSIFKCCSDGVAVVSVLVGVPFMLIQSLEIIGIHGGVFAPGQWYPAEWVAVTDSAVEQHQGNNRQCEPVRNCDGKD